MLCYCRLIGFSDLVDVLFLCEFYLVKHPTLCQTALALFSCIEVEADRYFLLADLEEECYKDNHLVMALTFGIFQITMYVVGLPVLGFYFMHRNRFRLDKHVVRTRFGLFLGGYRDERYYWEMFLVGRKGEK